MTLIVVGLWAGGSRGKALRTVPAGPLTGMVLGFLLAAPRSLAPIKPVIELAMLAARVGLAGAALMPLRLSLPQSISRMLLTGVLHSFTDRMEAGRVYGALFVQEYLATAALLLALGMGVGLASLRAPDGPSTPA